MSKRKSSHRVFSRAFKVGIVRRMLAGENVSALARELKATRKDLYVWRDRFLAGGPEALRGRGRPPKAEAARLVASGAKAQAAVRSRLLSASLAAGKGRTPAERRAWRDGVYEVIQSMTARLPQGEPTIARMCALARRQPGRVLPPLGGLGAAPGRDGGARRHPAPCAGPPSLWLSPDRSAAASRRLGGEPQKGLALDARRQSAVPEETSLRSGDNRLASWLAGGAEPCAWHGHDQPRPTLGRGHHLHPPAGGVCLRCHRARCVQPTCDWLGAGYASTGEPRY